jgi:hypothetical protein
MSISQIVCFQQTPIRQPGCGQTGDARSGDPGQRYPGFGNPGWRCFFLLFNNYIFFFIRGNRLALLQLSRQRK